MRILVVDDEKLLVKGLKFNLENEGYQVDACYDGRSAVDMARQGDYGLILLDLMMPELDGLEACMEIREFSTVPSSCSPPKAKTRTSSWVLPAGRTTM